MIFKKGDLVARKYRNGLMLDKLHGVVLRLDKWVQEDLKKAHVHFMDGSTVWIYTDRLEKLNK